MRSMIHLLCVLGLMAFVGLASVAADDVTLHGSGATFPNPIYQRWAAEYNKLHPNVKVDYASIGSGGGIKAITDKVVDFAGSDAPMNKAELEKAGGAVGLIEVPAVAGAVVMAYNVPGLDDLKLDGPTIADIYLGKVTKWNDAKIAALNPGAQLPDLEIKAAHRTDGSGTNFIFTNYLSEVSADFKDKVGVGKQVEFPGGVGGKGNEGVTAAVQQTKGTVGYVETAFANQNKLPYASLKNKDGQFVKPSAEAVSAAGEAAIADMASKNVLTANLWNKAGAKSYPLASFTYIIIYKDLSVLKDANKAKAVVDFLKWATTEGQKMAESMDYAPLSPAVQAKVQEALDIAVIGK